MRELDLAKLWLDAATQAGFELHQIEEAANDATRMQEFLAVHRGDVKLEAIERMLDCRSAPLTFYHPDESVVALKVLRHDDIGIVPWKKLKLTRFNPEKNGVEHGDMMLDEAHLLPKYLVGKKVANANICEFIRRYSHLVDDSLIWSTNIICWGTVYEGPRGPWVPGYCEGHDGVEIYDRHIAEHISPYTEDVLLYEILT